MKRGSCMAAALVFMGLVCLLAGAEARASECVKCHTDVKGLIKLGWEVEKVKPHRKSSATSGEG